MGKGPCVGKGAFGSLLGGAGGGYRAGARVGGTVDVCLQGSKWRCWDLLLAVQEHTMRGRVMQYPGPHHPAHRV